RQMFQPLVGDAAAGQGELFEACQLAERFDAQVGERHAAEVQLGELGKLLRVDQPKAADRAAVEDQAAEGGQFHNLGQIGIRNWVAGHGELAQFCQVF